MASKLISITIPAPGINGLNLQDLSSLQGPNWCRVGENLVIDETGRLATRKGWTKSHTTAISGTPDVKQVFEYKPQSGVNTEIIAAGNKLYKDRTNPTDITGALTITADNWKFQNFNGEVIGYQDGHDPIYWAGSGNFALLSSKASSAGLVQSNEVLSAWGRTWVVDPADLSTVVYSDLLQAHICTGGGAGSVDLASVWTRGADKIVALAAFNNQLIIFGKDSTVIYDGADTPSTMTLAEVIYDVGCVARDSIQYIDEDIFFLSRTGVRSYKRTLLRNKMPQADITKNVRDDIISKLAADDVDNIRSVYDKTNGVYLITFPANYMLYSIDIKKYVSSGEVRIFTWTSMNPLALCSLESGSTLAGFTGGLVGTLTGTTDNGTSYISTYKSGWMDLLTLTQDMSVSARLVILKKYEAVLRSNTSIQPILRWDFEQNDSSGGTRQITFDAGSLYEYNTGTSAEYNNGAEYGGSSTTHKFSVNTTGSGRTFSFGITVPVSGSSTSYQYINLMFKLGRIT